MSGNYINGEKIVSYIDDDGNMIIPDGVTELDEYCFTEFVPKKEYENGTLKEYIAVNFDTKKKIKSIFIPNSVKKLEESTFSDLVNLEKVTFQSGAQLKEIPCLAFTGCKSLKSIVLPDSVKYIDSFAFSDCGAISVYVDKDCKVNQSVFGSGECLSKGAKIIGSNNGVLTEAGIVSDTVDYIPKKDIDLDGFQIFLIVMIVVYLIAFIISTTVDSGFAPLIIIALGIANLYILFNS